MVLRIEDTDRERLVEGSLENLITTLDWADITYDEGPFIENDAITQKGPVGPYIQSERAAIHKEHAEKLIESGHAYYCFCTRDRLTELRSTQEKAKQATMYDRKCCDVPLEEARKRIAAGESHVIRQKIPYEHMKFKDIIRGNVQFDGKTIDDQVLVKSDGFPTYHLANVVDDHLMEITHVIRGEEWLPSTPKHIFLYKAFGWDIPEFAHIPLLLNKDGSKLSKRQGDVAVEDYVKKGYSKEALINFVAFLGWHPGADADGNEKNNEIFSLKELEEKFTLDRVHKSGAVFDIEKLDWFNWQWRRKDFEDELDKIAQKIDDKVEILKVKKGTTIFKFPTQHDTKAKELRSKRAEKLHELVKPYLTKEYKPELLEKVLLKTEEKILRDPKTIEENIHFFFKLPEYEEALLTHEKMKVDELQAKAALAASLETLKQIDDSQWEEILLQTTLLELVQKLEIKNGQLLWPIRAALTGEQFSPGAFEMLWALGKEEALSRIETAIEKLQ